MPTVPRIQRQGQTTALPTPTFSPSAPLDAFGGGPPVERMAAAGVNTLDNTIDRNIADQAETDKKNEQLFRVEKQRADQLAVQDFDLKASEAHTDIENKIKTLQGNDAFSAPEMAKDEWTKATDNLKKTLYNPDQLAAADKIIKARAAMLYQTAHDHLTSEREKYDDNETKGYLESVRNQGINNAMEEKRVALSIFQQKAALEKYGARKGLTGSEAIKSEIANAVSDTHMGVIEKRISLGNIDAARAYYEAHQGEIIGKDSLKMPEYIDAQEKRLKALKDDAKKKEYEATYRQDLLDSFSGKLTLAELQRQYRNDQIDDSTYKGMAHIVSDPLFSFMRPEDKSDPATFNAIREAQLSGTKTQGEILRMIGDAQAQRKIVNNPLTGNDGDYLIRLTKENLQPDPKDRQTDAQSQNVRDFATRYFSDHESWFQKQFGGDQTKKAQDAAVENMVSDFYRRVDKEQATGERIDEIAKEVQRDHTLKDHPEISRLSDMPHVIVEVGGKVRRVLNPDQRTTLKGQYSLKRNEAVISAPEKKAPKK